jgi:hypothetical protein
MHTFGWQSASAQHSYAFQVWFPAKPHVPFSGWQAPAVMLQKSVDGHSASEVHSGFVGVIGGTTGGVTFTSGGVIAHVLKMNAVLPGL